MRDGIAVAPPELFARNRRAGVPPPRAVIYFIEDARRTSGCAFGNAYIMYVSGSLTFLNNMRLSGDRVSQVAERLSSGLRINRGADDPSGLAIAKGMQAQSRGIDMALQNVQDGTSLINTMDGALAEIHKMLLRIKDLAIRASNEATLAGCPDRNRLNTEARGLVAEIDRTAKSVMFNSKKILSGDYLVSIEQTAGTEVVTESSATNPSSPGWADPNTVTFTAEVYDTGNQTGVRPSAAGGLTDRVFQSVIDAANNPTTRTQLTMDPSTLTDGDGDEFFDNGASVNDPDDASALYPAHEPATLAADDPDSDNDGWHATVDNADNDSTETGTDLLTLNADRDLPVASTTTSQDLTLVTWQNAVTRTFTAGVVDQADIVSTSGNTYSVQVFDTIAAAWTTVAGGLTGNQTINFAETTGNSIRVVYDEPVKQLAGVTNITGIRNKDVSLAGAAAAPAPNAYKYSFGAATQIDNLTIDASSGTYTVYKKVGGVISQVGAAGAAGTPTTYNPGAGVTDIWVDLDTAGATVTQFDAVQTVGMNAPAFFGTDGIQDFYQIDVTGGGPANVSDLDITLSNPVSAYDIYYNGNVPPGAPDNSGVGSGPKNLGGTVALSNIYIAVPTLESVTVVTATNAIATPAAVQEPRYSDAALTTPGQTVTSVDIEVTNGVAFQLYDDAGTLLGAGAGLGAGSPVTINGFGSVNPNSLQVRFDVGAGKASDVLAVSASATYALGAAANGFADVNPVNENIAVYQVNTGFGLVDRSFDQIKIQVMNGHPFSVQYSDDGAAWNAIATMTNISGTGAAVTYNFLDTLVDTGGNDAYFRVILHSGEKIATAVTGTPTFTNRIDRDGDGFPDVIETKGGSDPDAQASMPYGAVASTVGSPELAPDDDGDNYLDAPALYDTMDNPTVLASTNPYGFDWTDGSGNKLDSPGAAVGAQYSAAGAAINIDEIPSFVDADGDTINDPLDPFKATPEWQTWMDGVSTLNGNLVFVSNRANPNDPAAASASLYMGTTPGATGEYTMYSQIAGTAGADNPIFSADGTGLAWEDSTGGITASFMTTGCGGAVANIVQVALVGTNPTWSPDNSQIAYDDGSKILISDVDPAGPGAIHDYSISGTDPTWYPDGDTIGYTRGGQLYAFNFVTQAEYDLNISGTAPSFSPDGDRIAYLTPGGDVAVSSLTLTKTPALIQIGANNIADDRMSLSFPDARASKLGISGLSLLNQNNAESAMGLVDGAIDEVSNFRADAGTLVNRLQHIANDLFAQKINTEASRSRVEDAEMAGEYTELIKGKTLSSAAQFAAMHSNESLRISMLGVIEQTLGGFRTR